MLNRSPTGPLAICSAPPVPTEDARVPPALPAKRSTQPAVSATSAASTLARPAG